MDSNVTKDDFASKIKNIDGKIVQDGKLRKALRNVNMAAPSTFIAPLDYSSMSSMDKTQADDVFIGVTSGNANEANANESNGMNQSYASMFKQPVALKAVQLTQMNNEERLAFPVVENYVKNAWAKFGLERTMLTNGFFFFQFTTHEGMERVLENGPWLIRALVEVSSLTKLKESLIVAIPFPNGTGHSLETVDVEYEWQPPRCETCKIFDHRDMDCPKREKVVVPNQEVDQDGFTQVICKNGKGKQDERARQIAGTNKDTFPTPMVGASTSNSHYKGKAAGVQRTSIINSSKQPSMPNDNLVDNIDLVSLRNTFELLKENDKILYVNDDPPPDTVLEDEEEEFEDIYVEQPRNSGTKGAITPIEVVNDNLVTHKKSMAESMGDFNVSIHMDHKSTGTSTIDTGMCDFQVCMEEIEVSNVNSTGLKFTWNQKPHEPYRISDHAPVDIVAHGWQEEISGVWMFKVVKRLILLKKPLRKLLYDHGNVCENVKKLRHELDEAQKALDADPSNIELREEEVAYLQAFNDAIIVEERFLMQKAKVEWLKLGDANTTYFFKVVKSQASRNCIDTVTTSNGDCINGDQEIRDAIFCMGDNKALGPNGYSTAFFKEAWGIISGEVIKAVKEFFINGVLLKELNHTIIALIPKVTTPMRVNDYRPISCYNVLYKCISRIISNRMKDSLSSLVSLNQSAFVPGRRISDNILLTQELMHNYHLDRSTPRCDFKVDIQKAYDTVDWKFLKDVLIGFGFHPRMIGWIMECVTSTSFSLSINGSLHGYFKGKRGLHQGDPMSPYLFTLIMELNIINLCFADDLFLFAHGDVESARVIMNTLEEFKNASGLTPSLPKSTAYFCNVLNHIKLNILQILPFKEGKLPVKYLEVPLVPSRLLYRDCMELMEKVKRRINDRKNKSLSLARSAQIIRSVLGYTHVYWASVFILPSCLMLELKQLMRGFLWCQGEIRRGKAKAA
ncbi:reverse transcriptase domain-containing protein [Tanacetum coccineum]